jgi:hypothetical protein
LYFFWAFVQWWRVQRLLFATFLKKITQKKPGFLDWVFSDLELDPHVDGYQCGKHHKSEKKKTLARIYEIKHL